MPSDFDAFERIIEQAHERVAMRTLAYCIMPNHWHFVLWPREDDDVVRFVGWLTLTHTQRWHAWHRSAGTGHLYQGRYKSFPVQTDAHLLTVCRYVERNPLRAGLVSRAEEWRWCSLSRRRRGRGEADWLAAWPVPRPGDWTDWVNQPQTGSELEALRQSATRGRPFGDPSWVDSIVDRLGLASTIRPPGRPRKSTPDGATP